MKKKRTTRIISVFVPYTVERTHHEALALAFVELSDALSEKMKIVQTDILPTVDGLMLTTMLSKN